MWMTTRVPLLVIGLLGAVSVAASGCGVGSYALGADGAPLDLGDGQRLWTYRVYHEDHERSGFAGARAVAYYLPGSLGGAEAAEGVTRAIGGLAGFVMMNVRVVLIDRRGLEPACDDPTCQPTDQTVVAHASDKATRVADALRVIARDLPAIPLGMPIIVIGTSEGGDVAAAVAARAPRVTHLMFMSGGGGMSQADELRLMVARSSAGTSLAPGCKSPEDVAGAQSSLGGLDAATLERAFDEIRARPESDERWLGLPFRRWSSFAWSPPLVDLATLAIPIFVAHGTCDTAVPVESARTLAAAFDAAGKVNLRYREYAGLDHGFRDASGRNGLPHVELDVVAWLTELGVLDADEGRRYVARVRQAHPEWFP